MTQNADMRRESGTCNVCSAPCSSCMHFNRACMGSKAESSDENCRLGGTNQYSMDEGDVSSLRSRACESIQLAVSEASNMLSVNSSHDSLSENADSKQTSSSKCQDSKCLEGLDDNTSCISRASDPNLVSGSHPKNADRTNISCSSASVSLLGAEGCGSAPPFDMSKKSEFLTENIDSLLRKEIEPSVISGDKSLAVKDNLVDGNAKVSLKIYPKSEADTIIEVQDASDEAHNFSVQDEQDKAEQLHESPGMEEPQSQDESDESDVVEHDVKVCDICGDAGREDLLAICSRCSDGAEHTYCMREMLQKVPEGDWLCEECKCAEETENQRPDVEDRKNKVSSTSQHSGKRLSENIELAPVSKRQAVESSTGSPKSSSPKRIVALSRESSLKSLDKAKGKPDNQMPIRTHAGGDNMETVRSSSSAPRGLLRKGMLLKSNSFNTLNSKPRVKLVDEVVPQKLKGPGENSSKSMEIPARMIGKSMSFKSTSLGRSSAAASKVKLLSPKPIPAQDLKGTRHAKEWGAFERKNLSRVDRSVVFSTMATSVSTPKGDQKLTALSEISKPSSISNNRDLKANQDGKLSTISRSMSSVGRKGVEPQVSSGRTYTCVDETVQDVQPRLRETASQVEKSRDSSSDRVRADATATSKCLFCPKCKEYGHTTECCTIGKTQESGNEVSASTTSSSTEEMHKSNSVKAALQVALLRMQKKEPNQMDEFSPPGTEMKSEVTSQDQVLVSSNPKNSITAEETPERQDIPENSTIETPKCSSDEKQLNLFRTDSCSHPGNSDSIGPSTGKLFVRDLQNQTLAISCVLSKMAVPEYEYIWQGIFELNRSGKPPDLCAGIQAHLSTCVSPKVLEVVNKLPSKVPLNEVPRLSTWPSQFHQGGAKENNIALYFFAKDIESHERYYRGLVDHMMRNDLALKGIFDGVELLIFPSNQLPEKSQRWNMLFFLWGVFRGRRINHSDSAKKISPPSIDVMPVKDFPTAVMTLSETQCSPKRMDEESIDQGHLTVSRKVDVKETHLDQTHLGTQVNLEKQDSRFDIEPVSRIPASGTQFCEELKSTGSSLKGNLLECGPDRESKPSPGAIGTSVTSRIVETIVDPDTSVEQEKCLSSGIPSIHSQEIGASSTTSEENFSERMTSDSDKQRHNQKQKEDNQYVDIKTAFQGDLTVEGVNCEQPTDKKFQRVDLLDTVMQAPAIASKRLPWSEADVKLQDGENSNKKLKTDLSGVYGCSSSGGRDSFRNCFPSHLNDLGSVSSVKDKGCEEACDEKIIPEDLGTMERTFFPVDTHNKNESHLGPNSLSLKGPHEYVDQFRDETPNLELALGADMKPPHKGMLPFLVGEVDKKQSQEKPPDCLVDEEQEDDGVAASLSLSLSFPSSNKERMKTVSRAEQLLPDGRHVNTSLLLFGRFADK
ncbi:Bromodomain adjacent to zinc finger domain protein 1A [Senna tora]|uniref:Bromodomain adjacent to zinc finger domain protein 1A n=1 Tax=Senna tora TaxID=362788 RepID=A0A835CB10_9FABA|nr:Bromodomain adjacent to zinc finger domain protein 1A [Senna tora]